VASAAFIPGPHGSLRLGNGIRRLYHLDAHFRDRWQVCEDKDFKAIMASIGQPINYLNAQEWAAFVPKAYKDYGDMIKELDIKI